MIIFKSAISANKLDVVPIFVSKQVALSSADHNAWHTDFKMVLYMYIDLIRLSNVVLWEENK